MPLHLRRADNIEDDARDAYVVLTGGYCVGTFTRLLHGPSEGDWIWDVGFGHPIDDGGRAGTAGEAEDAVAASFRNQLARIGLAEVESSRLRPLPRKPAPRAAPHWDIRRDAQNFDREPPRGREGLRIAHIT